MKEKLTDFGWLLLVGAIEFWPFVVVPLITELILGLSHSVTVFTTIGAWLFWDFCGHLADEDDDGGGLVFGLWRRHRKRKSYSGYSAD